MARSPDRAPEGGWVLPALRNVAAMALVMGGIVAGLGGALAAWGEADQPYPEVVLEPAREMLVQHQALLADARHAAALGDIPEAKHLLEKVRAAEASFVRDVLGPNPPQAPELRPLHTALRDLYAALGDGLDLALHCLDDVLAGLEPKESAACLEGWERLAQAPDLAQRVIDQVLLLERQLAA